VVTDSNAFAGGTSLTVGAGSVFLFDPSQAAGPVIESSPAVQDSAAAVPEPGMLALLAAGAISAAFAFRRVSARRMCRRRPRQAQRSSGREEHHT
jgi:hypothetical protein